MRCRPMNGQQKNRWFHRSGSHAVVRSTGLMIHHGYKSLRRFLLLATGLLAVASCLLAATAWRLAQGPIDLGWLAARARAAFIDETGPIRVSFEGLELAWEGFHKGADHPLDLRVLHLAITDPAGGQLVAAPYAHLTFSLAGLLLGRIVPRTIEVDHAQVALTRETGGTVNFDAALDIGDAPDPAGLDLRRLSEQLAEPASTDHGHSRGILDQIQRAHFRNTEMTLRDRLSNLVVRTSSMDIDLVRSGNGHIRGSLQAPLALGNEQAALTVATELLPGGPSNIDLRLTPFRPAGVGRLPQALAFLSSADIPVSLDATVMIDGGFQARQFQATARLGEGQVKLGQGSIPVRQGFIALSGTLDKISISNGHLDFAQAAAGAAETADFSGSIIHVSDRITASLTVGIEQIDIADLPNLWPAAFAGSARSWVTEHVTAGMMNRGSASFVIEASDTLRNVVLTKATGELDGSNGVFTWLDNMPPVTHADVHLILLDPNTLDIHVSSGRQHVANRGADLSVDGQMHITGLSFDDQTAVIRTQIDGQISSALALLAEPRLHLLSAHPIDLKIGGGEASAILNVDFPLETKLRVDDVQIHANARLRHVHVLDVAGGQELADGAFDLDVDKDGLRLKGRAALATVPVTLDGTMDFNPGNPDQAVQRIAVAGQPTAAQLAAAGLPLKQVSGGPIAVTAVLTERRNGEGSVLVNGDLTQASLEVGPLAWSKPAGVVASATAVLVTAHGRLVRIERLGLRGDSLLLNGSANFVGGRIRSVQLDSIQLGRTQGHGSIDIGANDEIAIALQGAQLDLAPKLAEKTPVSDLSRGAATTTPIWTLNARFEHAILANGEGATGLLAQISGAGDSIRLLDIVGATEPGGRFSIKIEPAAGKRHLLVDARDAGRFLRGIDAIRALQTGHLTVSATFDSPLGFRPLAGTAVINDCIVQNSPLLGKLLQAITLYGLVDVLRGPGMAFSTVIMPFRYDGTNMNVDEAHADNPSLGLTADGRIGLASRQASITGTIVPAYFFNSLPGQLPLIGRLFSPEKGGGVFAARFGVNGPIDDPTIAVNAVSALTPGFLREIFSVFDKHGAGAPGPRQ
jgi:AsmA-like protein/uncharacterized protein DUF3971